MAEIICGVSIIIIVMLIIVALKFANQYNVDRTDKWKSKYDISKPDFENAGNSVDTANEEGWYVTLDDDFEKGLPEHWHPVRNGKRLADFWCESQVSVADGMVKINSQSQEEHICDKCDQTSGRFTSGITTRRKSEQDDENEFTQAFGYFEARVKIPDSDCLWSAFWLQSYSQGQIGNRGLDGSEIDIYESSFYHDRQRVGSCIHYDGYKMHHRGFQATHDVGTDTYVGFHTYAVKWTPNEYVFYFDGEPTWATDAKGTCTVPCYLQLTCEMGQVGKKGPYAQKFKEELKGGEFLVDYVKVYQNKNYLEFIKSAEDYQ